MFVTGGSKALDLLKGAVSQSPLGPMLTEWRIRRHDEVVRERRFKHALRGRRQAAVVIDVLYRVLLGRPANLSDEIWVRRRVGEGLGLMELAHELKASAEGSRVTVHAVASATRTYLRPYFDAENGERNLPRLVFLHIMKVGGTSLSDLFARWVGEERARVHFSLDELALTPAPVLANLRIIAGHIPFSALPLIPPPYHIMAVLRDPFARTLSHFSNIKSTNSWHRDLTLERFVFDDVFQAAGNYQARHLAYDLDLMNAWRLYSPEHRFAATGGDPMFSQPLAAIFDTGPVHLSDEELLRTAAANLARIDIVGVTDRLDIVAAEVARLFGRPAELVGHLNVSPPMDRHDVSERIRRRIDERTAVDRELYDIARRRVLGVKPSSA